MSKGGSKTVTAVVAFLIGFIFAIIVEAAAIFGVYYYVTNTDLDKIFEFAGIQNKDENGDYIYINTDTEDGGVKNLKELLGVLYGYIYSPGASNPDYPVAGKTFGEIEKLLPIAGGIVDKLSSTIDPFIDVDWDEFRKTPFTDIVMFMNDCVMETPPEKILTAAGATDIIGDDANVIVKAMFTGVETKYAQTLSGLNLPVFYDTYIYDERHDNYYRTAIVDQDELFPADKISTEYLVETSEKDADGNVLYRLYYVPCNLSGGKVSEPEIREDFEGNGFNDAGKRVYETIYAEGTSYIVVAPDAEGQYSLDDNAVIADRTSYEYPSKYGDNYTNLTGNFYNTSDGQEIQINKVTVNSVLNDTFEPLYYVPATELLGATEITTEIFSDMSVGNLINNQIDLKEEIKSLAIGSVVDNVVVTNDVMMYLVYKVTDVAETEKGFVGIYDKDGENIAVNIEVNENNQVTKVVSAADGTEIKGATVSEIADMADNLSVTVLLDVKADDAIMSYIGYGITNLREESGNIGGRDYDYVGKYAIDGGSAVCYVATDASGKITSVWHMDGGNVVDISATTVNTLSDRVAGITENLTLGGVVDITADNAIMVYMGYGVTNLVAVEGDGYSYTGKYRTAQGAIVDCFVKTTTDENGKEKVVSVWYLNGDSKVYLDGTTIGGITGRIDGIKNDLTIGEIMGDELTEENKILWALRHSTVNSLGDDVGQLYLSDVIDIDENSSNVLKQLKNTKIDDLSTAIDAITIQSIYAEEIYGKSNPEVAAEYIREYLYYVSDDNGGYELVNGTGKLTEEEWNNRGTDGVTYYTYGQAKGMWKLILYVEGEENVYTINNFHNMITHAAKNVQNATIRELVEAEILTGISAEKLEGTLKIGDVTYGKFGDIRLQDLVDIVLDFVSDAA